MNHTVLLNWKRLWQFRSMLVFCSLSFHSFFVKIVEFSANTHLKCNENIIIQATKRHFLDTKFAHITHTHTCTTVANITQKMKKLPASQAQPFIVTKCSLFIWNKMAKWSAIAAHIQTHITNFLNAVTHKFYYEFMSLCVRIVRYVNIPPPHLSLFIFRLDACTVGWNVIIFDFDNSLFLIKSKRMRR